MKNKEIVVPEEMIKASMIYNTDSDRAVAEDILQAALKWLSKNPIVPTDEQWANLKGAGPVRDGLARVLVIDWQRYMFLASEPEVPEEVKDLLTEGDIMCKQGHFNHCVIEAFKRGKAAR